MPIMNMKSVRLLEIESGIVMLVAKIPNFIIALADSNSKANKSPLIRFLIDVFPLDDSSLKFLLFLLWLSGPLVL